MKLNIPEKKAIEILNKRIGDLSGYNFQPKVWKDKTVNDLKEIFSVGDTKWLQISRISFDTFITAEKAKVLAEGKMQGKQLLESYIEQIKEYKLIQEEKEVIEEENYFKKYSTLHDEWNVLVPDYNKLLQEKEAFQEHIELKEQEITSIEQENQRIIENTVQLSNISLLKLIKLVYNLPTVQVVALLTVIIAVMVGSFKVGSLYTESSMQGEIYEIQIKNSELRDDIEFLTKKNTVQSNLLDSIKHELDSLSRIGQ